MPADAMALTLIEFHNQVSTGKGGGSTAPCGVVNGMPRASDQCSRLIGLGMRLPVEKLPGLSEIESTIRNGKRMSAMKAMRKPCARSFFQNSSRGCSTIIV